MPELPEVETTKKSLEPLLNFEIKNIEVYQPKLRWQVAENLDKLIGFKLTNIERRAKYLILTFTQSAQIEKLIIHLGMSGSLQQLACTEPKRKHDHVVFSFQDNETTLNYHDPRRFGAILWHDDYAQKLFDHLAPEPLSEAFSAKYLQQRCQKTSKNIKSIIMDQQYVVGVGNIYATESLFLSGIHPLETANNLSSAQFDTLVDHIKAVLSTAIKQGGSTLNDFTFSDGKTGYFQQTLLVYGRKGEPCTVCGQTLESIKITGRASCFCPNCQKQM